MRNSRLDKILTRDVHTATVRAYHGLTNVVSEITQDNCGLCYDFALFPLVYNDGNGNYKDTTSKQIVSLDDMLPIGPAVSDSYEMITNKEVWELVKTSLNGTKHIIDSVGSVKNREIAYISVKLNDGFLAAGRQTDNRLNFIWGHSGKMSLIAKTGLTVLVCYNSIKLALKKHSDFKLSVKHTKNAKKEIANLAHAIESHFGVCEEFRRVMGELANVAVKDVQAEKLFAGFVSRGGIEEALSTRSKNTVERLCELFKTGRGNNGDDLSDVLSAATDFYTHESSGGSNRWKQFESSEFGAGNRNKVEFFEILRDKEGRKELEKKGEKVLMLS